MAEAVRDDLTIAKQRLTLKRLLEARRRRLPSEHYEPHHTCARGPKKREDAGYSRVGRPSGQLQFHEATHAIRIVASGNGWGGTTAMGAEVDAWMRHTQRWQRTPSWPILAIWFVPSYKQFDIVRRNIAPVVWGSEAVFRSSGLAGPRYEWPDGGTLFLGSYDSSWTRFEGIEIDLVAFDEQPPIALWREMMQRRRGRRKTRYICKATQSKGWSWMAQELYLEWLKHHDAEPGSEAEERAMIAQTHPELWVWPKGGIHDNPGASEEDDVWYESKPWPSVKERKVRVYGGFESWLGDPVFDEDALEWLLGMTPVWDEMYGAAKTGMLAPVA